METHARASVSVVTIVGVFSLVSPAVVTIHPRASTKTRAQVNAHRRTTTALLSNRTDRTRTRRGRKGRGKQKGERREVGHRSRTSVRVRRERERGIQPGETTYMLGITAINAVSLVCFALDPPTFPRTHTYAQTPRRFEISPLCRFHSSSIASNCFRSGRYLQIERSVDVFSFSPRVTAIIGGLPREYFRRKRERKRVARNSLRTRVVTTFPVC